MAEPDGDDKHQHYPGVDLRYQPLTEVLPRDKFVRFSFGTHSLLVLAIVMAALCGTGMLWGTLRVALRPPALKLAIPMASRRTARSTQKANRLEPAPLARRVGPIANVVEVARQGVVTPFTYRKVEVKIGAAGNPSTASDGELLYQENALEKGPDPFTLLIKNGRPTALNAGQSVTRLPTAGGITTLPVRGVPINVSKAVEGPAPRIEHLVVMPKHDADMNALLVAANIEAVQRARLEDALKMNAADPSERLELLIDRPALRDVGARILAVRVQGKDGSKEVWAWDGRDGFKRLTNSDLFDRLSKEADVAAFTPSWATSSDVSDVAAGLPSSVEHLAAAGVPLPVAKQIADLARKSGISLDDVSSDDRSLGLLFRTNADGEAQLISVTFPRAGGGITFYRFRPSPDAKPEFFDAEGRSVSKVLLHKPVANGRLGDGFAWRLHPILNRWLHHNGVDYAAPYGSPVVAAGDGTVVLIGHEWGYGKYVRIKHDAGYFTTYAHISGVPPTLKVGDHVKQGQVIAYIGSTGLSTGPHLYYELRINGRYYDPLRAKLPAGTTLAGESLQSFRDQIAHVDQIDRYIDNTTAKAPDIQAPSAGAGHQQADRNTAPGAG